MPAEEGIDMAKTCRSTPWCPGGNAVSAERHHQDQPRSSASATILKTAGKRWNWGNSPQIVDVDSFKLVKALPTYCRQVCGGGVHPQSG
jgi:hypothetical protein